MRRLFAVALAALALSAVPAAARNVALVIGNDGYDNVPRLQKAVNDARSVSAELEHLGFTVRRAENLNQKAMSRAIVAFQSDVQPGDQALFYYSGHGFEIGGTNYLLPTDVPSVNANEQDLIKDAAFPVDRIVDGIRQRGAGIAILILDACRDNPFVGPGTRSLPGTRGLARVDAPEGVFVLMSAGAKQAALDRLSDADQNPNSIFTRTFLGELDKPGQTLVQIAKRTQIAVKALAASVGHDQVPGYYDQVLGDVVLNDGSAGPAVAAVDAEHVSGNVPTEIHTGKDTQAGAGVSMGAGVKIGPGVIIGGKETWIAVQNPANAPKDDGAERQIVVQGSGGNGEAQTAMLGAGSAPIANFMRSSAGWTVTLSMPEPATSISWRLNQRGEYRDTGLLDILDQRTGQRMPNPSFQLSGKAEATVIQVRYRTPDGGDVGPFPIRFDPDVALFDTQRKALEQIWPSWVEFREYNGLLVYFTSLISYRCALTEVRYGLNGADPLRRYDLPACDPKNPFSIPEDATVYMKVPEDTASITIRLTWRDGTQSDVYTIEK